MRHLERLIEIRSSRLAKSHQAELAAKHKCKQQRLILNEAQEAISTYRKEIENLEFDLLLDLIEKEVTTQAVFQLEQMLKEAEKKAQYLADRLTHAREALSIAESEVEQARNLRQEAKNRSERLYLLEEFLKEGSRIQAQAAEERALEEIVDALNTRRWNGYGQLK